jgi:hypothetical protein
VDGDAALASYFLDPERAIPALEKQLQSAQIGGIGSQFGINVNRGIAQGLAERGITEDSARRGFETIQRLAPVFDETIGESTNLAAEEEGINAAFSTGGDSARHIQNRLDSRKAAFSGGGGAAMTSSQSGIGSARSR